MPDSASDLTGILTTLIKEDSGIGFRSGIVQSFDAETGQSVIVIAGAPISNIPFLSRTEALSLQVGDVVGILKVKNQYFVLGRISVAGGAIEVRDDSGDVRMRLGLDELRFVDENGRELILSPDAQEVNGDLPATPMMAFPRPFDANEETPAFFGNDSFGVLTMQARRVAGSDRTLRVNKVNLINAGVQIGNGTYSFNGFESVSGTVTIDVTAQPPGSSATYGMDITGTGSSGTVRLGRLGSTGSADVDVIGDFTVTGAKSFRIDHPTKEGFKLQHGSTESPVSGVEYWGNAVIDDSGEAKVELPEYFEALTKQENRTVLVTPKRKMVDWTDIEDGTFAVMGEPGTEFSWLVKAEREGADFEVEKRGRP